MAELVAPVSWACGNADRVKRNDGGGEVDDAFERIRIECRAPGLPVRKKLEAHHDGRDADGRPRNQDEPLAESKRVSAMPHQTKAQVLPHMT